MNIARRLRSRSTIDPDTGCWTWIGAINHDGYGQMYLDGLTVRAHRVSYVQHLGPIPEGLEIDHLCRNRACINPFHLEPVLHAENIRRSSEALGIRQYATHCKWGHEFTAENTYLVDGKRTCRPCNSATSLLYHRRKSTGPLPPATHCKHGHEFTPENTYYAPRPSGTTKRSCRACNAHRQQQRRDSRAAA